MIKQRPRLSLLSCFLTQHNILPNWALTGGCGVMVVIFVFEQTLTRRAFCTVLDTKTSILVYFSVQISIYLSIYPYFYLSDCLSICLSIFFFIYISIYLSKITYSLATRDSTISVGYLILECYQLTPWMSATFRNYQVQ